MRNGASDPIRALFCAGGGPRWIGTTLSPIFKIGFFKYVRGIVQLSWIPLYCLSQEGKCAERKFRTMAYTLTGQVEIILPYLRLYLRITCQLKMSISQGIGIITVILLLKF